MTSSGESARSARELGKPPLRRLEQATIAVIIGCCLLVITVSVVSRRLQRGGLIELEDAPTRRIEFRVDPNEASWPELMLLPEVGETLARRIVEFRQEHGPFTQSEDLLEVNGVGPRTLERIRPHLHFPDSVDSALESSARSAAANLLAG